MSKFYKPVTSRLFCCLVAFFIFSINSQAQLALTRSNFNGTYTPITTGGGATTSTATGDDAVQVGIPIGFTFNYLGTNFTTCQVSTNGWLSFNATAVPAFNARTNPNLHTATVTSLTPNTVAPWWDDLTTASILFQTQGAPGSQTFTVQWNSSSFFTGGKTITFQAILYEGTNIIEFRYGAVTGTVNISESASIGVNNATGGVNNYIDAVTGSANTGSHYMQTLQWPNYYFRFTPGLPAVLPGGTYNVGAGQTYRNLSEAVADVNHRGISGAVTLNLTDAVYDTTSAGGFNIFPVLLGVVTGNSVTNTITITKSGAPAAVQWGGCRGTAGGMSNQASTAINTVSNEAIIGITGTDYVTIENIALSGNVGSRSTNHAIGIYNSSATDGATNNTIQNVSVVMNRGNTASRGFFANVVTTPTSVNGANSNNTFRNFSITNVYGGIQLTGNATFPDVNTSIGNTVCTNFNTIGNPAQNNDIGGATLQTYGILATNQSAIRIFNNSIRNVTNTGGQADGINVTSFQGISEVYNNKIQTIRNSGTASTTVIAGIRATHNTIGTHTLRIYNNAISEINSGYTGLATATRTLRGIFIAGTGGGITQSYEVFDNSVSIDGSSSLNLSSSCFEVASATGPVYLLGNNIFSNRTATQTGVARHYCLVSPSATAMGNTGTTSNNNDLYIANDAGVTGFVGLGAATTYITAAAWTTGMTGNPGLEATSTSFDPMFVNPNSDLHSLAAGANGTGIAPIASVVNDLDCIPRGPDNDIGAFVVNTCTGTPTAGTITGVASVCTGSGTTLNLTGATIGVGMTYQWASSTTPGGPYTNMGTTLSQATGPLTSTTYYIVTVNCSSGGTAVTSEYTLVVNPIPVVTVSPAAPVFCTGGSPVALTASGATTYTWAPATGLSATTGTTVNASPAANTTYTVTGTALGCVGNTTVTVTTTQGLSISSVTATPPNVCVGGNTVLQANAVMGAATYCAANHTVNTSSGDFITVVNLNGMVNTTVGNPTLPNYTLYTTPTTSLTAGTAYTITLTAGTFTNNDIAAWIDYDQDGVFNNVTEKLGQFFGLGATPATTSFNFTVPAGALNGQTRLRVRETDQGTLNLDPCLTYGFGETEDYVITITGGASPAFTYLWSEVPSNGTLTSTTTNPTNANNILVNETYNVTVSNLAGCTVNGSVTVLAGAPLVCSSITTTGVLCGGQNFTLTANTTGGGAPLTYVWSDGVGGVYPNAATITANLSAGTYNFSVTVTDPCAGLCTTTATVVVNAAPVITVTPPSGLICNPGGSPVALTASGASTYSWTPVTGLSSTTGANVNANPTATTTYTVTGTSVAGCVSSTPVTITLGNSVTLSSVTATPTAVCVGGTSTLSAIASQNQTYCAANHTVNTSSGDFITVVNLNGMVNTTTGNPVLPNYTLYTTPTTTLTAGTAYTITLTAGTFTNNDIAAWIDYNQDGIFNNVTEKLGQFFGLGATPANTTFNFTVPAGAINGATRLRVRETDQGTLNLDPCLTYGFGETEDYIITITGGIPNTMLTYTWSEVPAGTTLTSTSTNPTTATGITATTTYNLTVSNAAGCTATGSATVTAGVPLACTGITVPANICSGQDFTAAVTTTGGGSPLSYAWSDGVGGVYPNAASITANLATGTYNFSVTVTDPCSGTCTSTLSVTVNGTPVITVTPPSGLICNPGGSPVALTASGGVTYAWSPAAGLSATTGATVTATPTTTTTYTVSGTAANGCIGSIPVIINVGQSITVSSVTATPSSICVGGSTTLTANASQNATYCAANHTVNTSSGDFITVVNLNGMVNTTIGNPVLPNYTLYTTPTTTLTAGTAYTITLTAGTFTNNDIAAWIDYNQDGIFNNVTEKLGQFFGLGATPANTTFNFTVPAGAINGATRLRVRETDQGTLNLDPCLTYGFGETEDYVITITGGATLFTYAWTEVPVGTTLTSTSTNPTTATGITGNTTYNVTVSNAAGCSATGTVNVVAGVPLACTGITVPATICSGQDFTATVGTTGGGSPLTYVWSDGVGGVYPNAASITGNLAAGTYNFSVTVTDPCSGTCTSTLSVTVNATPVISVTPPSGGICNPGGSPIVLTASGASTYAWAPAAGLSATTGAVVTANPAITTLYTVTGTSVAGCISTAPVTINVGTAPTITSVTATPNVVCPGGSTTLTVNMPPPITYCQPVTSCTFPDIINNVTFGGLNQNSACNAPTGGYSFITTPIANVTAGSSVPYSITTSGDVEGAAMWIDYNQDGTFAPTEQIFNGFLGTNPAIYSGTTLIPLGALNGQTRMRVRCLFNTNPNTLANPPCSNATFGETEDYIVNITGGVTPPPAFTFLWTESPANGTLVSNTTNPATANNITVSETYTVTVTNVAGCVSTGNVTVNLDNIAPTITCPADITVNTDPGMCTSSASLGTPTTADNCTVASVTNDAPTGGLPVGTTVVTWTVTDNSGNVATCTQNVTVTDAEMPVITCPPTANINTDAGSCTSTASIGTPTTSDNCGIASVTNDAPASFPVGTTFVTWTVTDNNGNVATCVQMVTVTDVEAPVIICPADVNASTDPGMCTASGASVALGTPVTTDNCTVAFFNNNAPGTYFLGATSVSWLVIDIYGNMSTCIQTVTITDTELPVVTCPANITVNNDPGLCTASGVALGTATATDNCGVVGSPTNNAPAAFPAGVTTVTWSITDVNGNVGACTQTVTVIDTEIPTITCPANVSVNTDAGLCTASGVALGTPVAADNCLIASVTNDAPAIFPTGVTTVTWTVTDANGNTATCTQTVTVTDGENPTITCPADLTVSADAGICTASGVPLGTPTTSDNCGVATVTNDAPAVFPVGVTTVTWVVTDVNGNMALCLQNVTVNDTQNPTMVCGGSVTVNTAPGVCGATGVVLGAPSATDNCMVASVVNDAPASYPVGTTTVTWTATDASGNMAFCTQSVTVVDIENPTIVCPPNINISTDAGSCTATGVALGTPATSDNCTVATVVNDAPASFAIGVTSVTWTVTDVNGNIATCVQTITVTDNENPTILCPANVTSTTDASACTSTTVVLGTPVTADNCLVATVTNDAPAAFPTGVTTVTWTVTDASGNTATCTQTVTVTDNEAPVAIGCSSNISINTNNTGCTGIATWPMPSGIDNCGTVNITSTHNSGDAFPVGTTTVTYTFDDGNGNSTTCSFDVTVTNDLSASAVGTDALCNGTPTGNINLTVSGGDPIYLFDWDNDGTGDTDDFEDIMVGAGTYNVTVIDANGCTANASATISEPTLLDVQLTGTVDPTGCTSNDGSINITVSGGTAGYTFDWDNDGTGDNDDAEDLSGVGSGMYTVVVTDANGCTNTITATLNGPGVATITIDNVGNVLCNGGTTGSVDITVTLNGTATSYTTVWDDVFSTTTDDITGLGIGTYTVTVTDNNACVSMASVTITEPVALTATTAVIDVSCNGASDGSIDLTVAGGTPGFMYDWDNDGTGDNDDTEDLTGLVAGTYTVIVTDANGCTTTTIATVSEPTPVVVTGVVSNTSCVVGASDGGVNITPSGGTPGYIYDWDNDGTGDNDDVEDISGLAAGAYNVIVIDSKGCTGTATFTISTGSPVTFSFTTTLCAGNSVTVGSNTYTTTGVYTDVFTGGAANGCDSTVISNITVNPPVNTNVTQIAVTLTASSTAGNYQWMDCDSNTPISGATNQSFTATVNGNYAVIVVELGCPDTSACVLIDDVGFAELGKPTFNVYPNPSAGVFNIESSTNAKAIVFNMLGEQIQSLNIYKGKNQLNLDNIACGPYMLRIVEADTDEVLYLQRLLIQK